MKWLLTALTLAMAVSLAPVPTARAATTGTFTGRATLDQREPVEKVAVRADWQLHASSAPTQPRGGSASHWGATDTSGQRLQDIGMADVPSAINAVGTGPKVSADSVLDAFSHITGHLTNAASTPLQNISVTAYRFSDGYWAVRHGYNDGRQRQLRRGRPRGRDLPDRVPGQHPQQQLRRGVLERPTERRVRHGHRRRVPATPSAARTPSSPPPHTSPAASPTPPAPPSRTSRSRPTSSATGTGSRCSTATGSTNSTGDYNVGGLKAGTYRIGFRGSSSNYVEEFWNDQPERRVGHGHRRRCRRHRRRQGRRARPRRTHHRPPHQRRRHPPPEHLGPGLPVPRRVLAAGVQRGLRVHQQQRATTTWVASRPAPTGSGSATAPPAATTSRSSGTTNRRRVGHGHRRRCRRHRRRQGRRPRPRRAHHRPPHQRRRHPPPEHLGRRLPAPQRVLAAGSQATGPPTPRATTTSVASRPAPTGSGSGQHRQRQLRRGVLERPTRTSSRPRTSSSVPATPSAARTPSSPPPHTSPATSPTPPAPPSRTSRSAPTSSATGTGSRSSTGRTPTQHGDYNLGGLKAGTYRIGFRDDSSGNYLEEFWNDQPDVESATDIVVGAGDTVGGKDAVLAPAAHITGRLTNAAGTPLQNISVDGLPAARRVLAVGRCGSTDADGQLQRRRPQGRHLPDRVPRLPTATTSRSSGTTNPTSSRPRTSSSVPAAPSVARTPSSRPPHTSPAASPTPPAPPSRTSRSAPTSCATGTGTDGLGVRRRRDGNYNVGGLKAGTYRIGIRGLQRQLPRGVLERPSQTSSRPRTSSSVPAAPSAGKDAVLAPASHITGHLTNASGTRAQDVGSRPTS